MGESATALVVPEVATGPGPMALWEEPTQLAAKLDRYAEARGLFIAWLFKNLTAGIDYMLIHRRSSCPRKDDATSPRCPDCGGKATLCKPGSEKLCGLLQLTPRFKRDLETWEMLGKVDGHVCFVCELETAAGAVVAEGRGARNLKQDNGDINKCVKMCSKSAQTDAIMRYAGLSEIFTQDLDDAPLAPAAQTRPKDDGPPPTNWEGMAQEMFPEAVDVTPKPEKQTRVVSTAISPAKVKRLFALLHGAATAASGEERGDAHTVEFTRLKEALHAWLSTAFGNREFEAIHWREYDGVCAMIEEGRL